MDSILIGDLWTLRRARDWVVVPTNIGWKSDGTNPMGAGIARKAADLFAPLPAWYGSLCQRYRSDLPTAANPNWRLILFPTKPLNADAPHLSWRGPATLERIEMSLQGLRDLIPRLPYRGRILLPLVGAGAGGLSSEMILGRLTVFQQADPQVHIVVHPAAAMSIPCPTCAIVEDGPECADCGGSGKLLPKGYRPAGTPTFDDPLGLGFGDRR